MAHATRIRNRTLHKIQTKGWCGVQLCGECIGPRARLHPLHLPASRFVGLVSPLHSHSVSLDCGVRGVSTSEMERNKFFGVRRCRSARAFVFPSGFGKRLIFFLFSFPLRPTFGEGPCWHGGVGAQRLRALRLLEICSWRLGPCGDP